MRRTLSSLLSKRTLAVPIAVVPNPPSSADSTVERVFLDAAVRFLDLQISSIELMDREALSTLTIGSAVLPLTFGLLNLGSNRPTGWAVVCFVIALAAYLVLLSCSFRVTRLRGIEYRPSLPTLQEHSRIYDGSVLTQWIGEEYVASSQQNQVVLERKARWAGGSFLGLYVEGLSLAVAALVTLLG